jgi:transposase
MEVTPIGLDIAKNVFQVHGIDASEKVVVRKQLRRGQVLAFFEALPPLLVGASALGCASRQVGANAASRPMQRPSMGDSITTMFTSKI